MKPTFEELFNRAAVKAGFTVRPVVPAALAPERPARRPPAAATKRAGRNGRAAGKR